MPTSYSKHSPLQHITTVRSVSYFNEYTLAIVLPALSTVKLRTIPIPAYLLSDRANNFARLCFRSYAPSVSRVTSRFRQLKLGFSTVCANFLKGSDRVTLINSFVEHFSSRQALILISPIVKSNNRLCSACAPGLVHNVSTLYQRTRIVAPGLARTYFLASAPCTSASNVDRHRLSDFTGRLYRRLTRANTRGAILAKLRTNTTGLYIYKESGKDNRCFRCVFPHISEGCPNANSLFTDIILNRLVEKTALRNTSHDTSSFIHHIVRCSSRFPAPRHRNITFRTFLKRLTRGKAECKARGVCRG